MSESIVKAVLGGRLRIVTPQPPEVTLLNVLLEDRGLNDTKLAERVRNLLRTVLTTRIINDEDIMKAAYAVKSKYIPLDLAEALKELL